MELHQFTSAQERGSVFSWHRAQSQKVLSSLSMCRLDAPVGIEPCLGGVGFGDAGLLCITLEKKRGSTSRCE